MNTLFREWCGTELVWIPSRGIGWLTVTEAPYDAAYFQRYEEYAGTPMGAALTDARGALVRRWAPNARICDVGIGCGAFVAEMGCVGFDVNPAGVTWLKNRRAWYDPWKQPVDALTFWDVLEHIPNPAPLLSNAREWVFCSIPIVPGDGPPTKDWKHIRPTEHCLYFTRNGLIGFMREHGFECVEHNTEESLIGREDIHSFAFRRCAH